MKGNALAVSSQLEPPVQRNPITHTVNSTDKKRVRARARGSKRKKERERKRLRERDESPEMSRMQASITSWLANR